MTFDDTTNFNIAPKYQFAYSLGNLLAKEFTDITGKKSLNVNRKNGETVELEAKQLFQPNVLTILVLLTANAIEGSIRRGLALELSDKVTYDPDKPFGLFLDIGKLQGSCVCLPSDEFKDAMHSAMNLLAPLLTDIEHLEGISQSVLNLAGSGVDFDSQTFFDGLLRIIFGKRYDLETCREEALICPFGG